MPGDGAGHIAPNRTIQVRGIPLQLLGYSVIPLGITDLILLKAVLALALVITSIFLGKHNKQERQTDSPVVGWSLLHHCCLLPSTSAQQQNLASLPQFLAI